MLPSVDSEDNDSISSIPRKIWNKSNLQYGHFIQTIATADRPVVLYRDDVQWMDDLTLDLVQSTLLDHELKHLVFVASFRNNEVYGEDDREKSGDVAAQQQQHNVEKLIQTLKKSSRGSAVQEMTLENLNLATVQTFLTDILRADDEDGEGVVSSLAKLILERTGGNPFYIIQLLEHLEARKLLEYSLIHFRWTWDIDRIRDETMVTQNVAEILKDKIQLLSPQAIEVLKQCACLGYRFHEMFSPLRWLLPQTTRKSTDLSFLLRRSNNEACCPSGTLPSTCAICF